MAPIKAILARGAGNALGNNFTWDVARLLDKKIFSIVEIPYYAEIRPIGTHTLRQSVANFKALADRELAAKVPWMGVGYSLGALALGDFVRQISLSKCKGIGFLSDPGRDNSQYMGTRKPPGPGVAGARKVGNGSYPVWSYTARGDSMSELRPEAGLRKIAGALGAPSDAAPSNPLAFAQAFQDPGLIQDLINYGPGGRHTCYVGELFPGTNRTYSQHLADQMNAEGRRLVAAGVV